MPSDAKKREQQRKKDAAKARQTNKKTNVKAEDNKPKANGVTENGSTELSPEGKNVTLHLLVYFKSCNSNNVN